MSRLRTRMFLWVSLAAVLPRTVLLPQIRREQDERGTPSMPDYLVRQEAKRDGVEPSTECDRPYALVGGRRQPRHPGGARRRSGGYEPAHARAERRYPR